MVLGLFFRLLGFFYYCLFGKLVNLFDIICLSFGRFFIDFVFFLFFGRLFWVFSFRVVWAKKINIRESIYNVY